MSTTRSAEVCVPQPRIPSEVQLALDLIRVGAHDPREHARAAAQRGTERAVAALILLATAVWSFDGAMLLWP